MINLSPEICQKIRDARRAAKLSQSILAAEVGCKQSALSMFEQGDGTKLNDEVIEKLATRFKIDLKPRSSEPVVVTRLSLVSNLTSGSGYCPNPHCPANHLYTVEGRDLLRPDRSAADPVGGRFCACCGELLERHCPNCGARVHDGAICSYCGEPYIAIK